MKNIAKIYVASAVFFIPVGGVIEFFKVEEVTMAKFKILKQNEETTIILPMSKIFYFIAK